MLLSAVPLMPPNVLGQALFFGSILLGALLPLLRYHNRYYGVFVPFGILIAWFIVLYFVMPPIVKQAYIAQASQIAPVYTGLPLDNVSFSPSDYFDKEPAVSYTYRSDKPKDDYTKLHDFYQTELGKKGWVVLQDYDDTNRSDVIFWNKNYGSSNVNVGYDKKTSSVGVSVDF